MKRRRRCPDCHDLSCTCMEQDIIAERADLALVSALSHFTPEVAL